MSQLSCPDNATSSQRFMDDHDSEKSSSGFNIPVIPLCMSIPDGIRLNRCSNKAVNPNTASSCLNGTGPVHQPFGWERAGKEANSNIELQPSQQEFYKCKIKSLHISLWIPLCVKHVVDAYKRIRKRVPPVFKLPFESRSKKNDPPPPDAKALP